jgi:hypothetical protein
VNIAHTEEDHDMVAKTCGCKNTKRKVTYSFIDSYHSLCRDKKDMRLLLSQPVKDASDRIKTGFTVIRGLGYKLNLYSRAQICSCCLRFYRLRGENISFL